MKLKSDQHKICTNAVLHLKFFSRKYIYFEHIFKNMQRDSVSINKLYVKKRSGPGN